jgi:hypothetical protein
MERWDWGNVASLTISTRGVEPMAEAMLSDHRRYRRYALKGEVFVGSRPFFHTIGSLRDISEGGAGFEYFAGNNNDKSRTVEVDITCGKHFRLSRLPCKVAYDIQVDQSSSGSIGMRRCGLEFGRLSYQQADLLSLILESCAPRLRPPN